MGNERREKINALKGCQPVEEEDEEEKIEENMDNF